MFIAKYRAAYKIQGLANLGGADVVPVLERTEPTVRISLRRELLAEIEEHLRHIAIANIRLDTMFGGEVRFRDLPLPERIAAQINAERSSIESQVGKGVFLYVEADDPDVISALPHRQSYDGFDATLDAIPAGHFTSLTAAALSQAVAATLSIIKEGSSKAIRKLFAYASVQETERPNLFIHNMTVSGSGSATLASPPPAGFEGLIARRALELGQSAELETPLDLLAQSSASSSDALLSFVLGWSALELLTQKLFAHCRLWESKLAGQFPGPAKRYFESTKRILDSRVNLADRFVVVAETLNPSGAAGDVAQFMAFKKERDSFFHAPGEVPAAHPIRELVAKYVGLHADQKGEA